MDRVVVGWFGSRIVAMAGRVVDGAKAVPPSVVSCFRFLFLPLCVLALDDQSG